MGGVTVELVEVKRGPPQDNICCLCKQVFREPFSGKCKHAGCKSCLVVLFTRDLPDLNNVPCPVCKAGIKLQELKPDQTVQRRLQKVKNVKCRHCNWKGTYSEYCQTHERVCGGNRRIQCSVLGCGKWLPKDKALDAHRTDDWCPMILLMKIRLSTAEIVHLSMRESWDWTCGLVLRSDKEQVKKYIERLDHVFSIVDPSVPRRVQNDEFAAALVAMDPAPPNNELSQSEDSGSLCNGLSSHDSSQTKSQAANADPPSGLGDDVDGLSGMDSEPDGRSVISPPRTGSTHGDGLSSSGPEVSAVSSPGAVGMENGGFTHQKDKVLSMLEKDMNTVNRRLQKIEKDVAEIFRVREVESRRLDDLVDAPRAIAALDQRYNVMEGVMATFNNELARMDTKLNDFQLPTGLANNSTIEKLLKANQDFSRSIATLVSSVQKLETRLLEVDSSHTGVYLWKIPNYRQKKYEVAHSNIKSIYSPPFFTSQYGYKLCGRVFLMGDGVGKGTHISLFLTIMRGPNDAVLHWPFREKITFELVNQGDPSKSIVEAFRPDPASSSFKRPTSERNIGAGCPLFAKIVVLEDPTLGFLKDDTIYLKIISQTSDLPESK